MGREGKRQGWTSILGGNQIRRAWICATSRRMSRNKSGRRLGSAGNSCPGSRYLVSGWVKKGVQACGSRPAVSHRRPRDRCADAAGVCGTNGDGGGGQKRKGRRLAAQGVAARLASRTKRARVSMDERVSPIRMALEELVKPKKGDRFKRR
jgi:hypothetical protein